MFQNEFNDGIYAEISVVLNGKWVLLFGYCVVTRQLMNSEGSIVQRNLNTVRDEFVTKEKMQKFIWKWFTVCRNVWIRSAYLFTQRTFIFDYFTDNHHLIRG